MATMSAMPPTQQKRKIRTVRIEDQLWEAAQAKAEENGETVTDVIRRALKRYVKQP